MTSKARYVINQSIRNQRSEYISAGKEQLTEQLKKQHLSINEESLQHIISHFRYQKVSDLYHAIGEKKVTRSQLNDVQKILLQAKEKNRQKKTLEKKKYQEEEKNEQDNLLIGDNLDTIDYKLAPCCNPIPGDEVFGFVTGQDGIKIHRTTCRNAPELLSQHGERGIRAQWASVLHSRSRALLQIRGIDRIGMIQDIMHLVSTHFKVNTEYVKIRSENGLFTGEIRIFVDNKAHLQHLIDQIKKIPGIAYVVRTDA